MQLPFTRQSCTLLASSDSLNGVSAGLGVFLSLLYCCTSILLMTLFKLSTVRLTLCTPKLSTYCNFCTLHNNQWPREKFQGFAGIEGGLCSQLTLLILTVTSVPFRIIWNSCLAILHTDQDRHGPCDVSEEAGGKMGLSHSSGKRKQRKRVKCLFNPPSCFLFLVLQVASERTFDLG